MIVVLAFLTALQPRGRRLFGLSVGVTAGYLGVVSWAWPETAAGFSRFWSIAALSWGILVAVHSVIAKPSKPVS